MVTDLGLYFVTGYKFLRNTFRLSLIRPDQILRQPSSLRTLLGTLLLVATPIGNLRDLSPRGMDSLQTADRIGCEDTRTTGILLKHFSIERPLFSLHQHNEHQKVSFVVDWLNAGETIAIVTDAGMPGISDPGFLLTRAVHQENESRAQRQEVPHQIQVIPGPDACTTALTASGLPSDRYVFEGFLPHKKGRKTRLDEIQERTMTTVLYESPHRVQKLLSELHGMGDTERYVCVSRELTKVYEEHVRGTVEKVKQVFDSRESIKGEIAVVIAPKSYRE